MDVKCLNCGRFSWRFLCKTCLFGLSYGEAGKRNLGDFSVYYFYKYEIVKHLLHTKHRLCGSFVYGALANLTFARFGEVLRGGVSATDVTDANARETFGKFVALPVDDKNESGYSHTAVLARSLRCEFIEPVFGKLRAANSVKYSGKSLEFRRANPRGFSLDTSPPHPVILVDDIVTSGTTLREAKRAVESAGGVVAFGLVLADAES